MSAAVLSILATPATAEMQLMAYAPDSECNFCQKSLWLLWHRLEKNVKQTEAILDAWLKSDFGDLKARIDRLNHEYEWRSILSKLLLVINLPGIRSLPAADRLSELLAQVKSRLTPSAINAAILGIVDDKTGTAKKAAAIFARSVLEAPKAMRTSS